MFVNRLAVILFRLTNLMIILRIFSYYFKVDEAGYVIILRTCVLLKNIHLGNWEDTLKMVTGLIVTMKGLSFLWPK